MKFLYQPSLGSIAEHSDVGAVCAGVSLQPLSAAAIARFAAIGGDCIVDAAVAADALAGVVAGPLKVAEQHGAKLSALASRAEKYVEEAGALFPIGGGDEADAIVGMRAAIVGAMPALPANLFNDADFLHDHLHLVAGFDPKPLGKALDALAAHRAKIDGLADNIDGALGKLDELRQCAASPEAAAEARHRKISAKAARLMPSIAARLRELRDEIANSLARVDRALTELEKVT